LNAKSQGVDKNAWRSVTWYLKAAEQGDVWAQYNLGNMNRRGDEVPEDHAAAVRW